MTSAVADDLRGQIKLRVAASFNKPDAANPALALRLTEEGQWRRVADLER